MTKWILYMFIAAFSAAWFVGYFFYSAGSYVHGLLLIAILLGVWGYAYNLKTIPSKLDIV